MLLENGIGASCKTPRCHAELVLKASRLGSLKQVQKVTYRNFKLLPSDFPIQLLPILLWIKPVSVTSGIKV